MNVGQAVRDAHAPEGAGNPPDVPAGYKHTDVGVIPEDWEVDRIDQHTFIKTGSRNTQDKREGGEYPFFVRSQEVERIGTYSYDGEAVLTAGDGVGTGKVFHYVRGRFDVYQRVYRISDFSDWLDGLYFFFQFSERFYRRIMSMTAKSSVDSVRMEMIAGMRIPLPPPSEQRAIAAVLSDVDELIGSLEALIAKKRATKKAAMQQLLTGRTRLPGFSGKYEARRINELADVDPENLPSDTDPGFFFNYISLDHVDGGRLIGYSRESFATAPSRARRVLRASDVLMSTVRPGLQGHLIFVDQVPNAVCSTGFAVLRSKRDRCDPRFLFAHLFGDVVSAQVQKLLAGSNYPAVNSGDVGRLRVPCPPTLPEQRAIATVLFDMDAEIVALERRLDKTRAIKQGMMQQLLTGSMRLPIPDANTEDDDAHDA